MILSKKGPLIKSSSTILKLMQRAVEISDEEKKDSFGQPRALQDDILWFVKFPFFILPYELFLKIVQKRNASSVKGGDRQRNGTSLRIWVYQDQCQESQQYQQYTKRDRSISTDLSYQTYSEFIDVLYLLNHPFQSTPDSIVLKYNYYTPIEYMGTVTTDQEGL